MKPVSVTLAVIVAASATFAFAQQAREPPQKTRPPVPAPAPAAQGVTGVQQCIACHGERGEGNAQGGFPRLAGQSQAYLVHQLESYADGSRRNPVMEPIAKGLSREARAAAAEYYARSQPPAAAEARAATANERGELLATRGDDKRQIQACGNCHGPGGIGEPPEIPYLAGLDAPYLASALTAFKSGARRNDSGQQMRAITRAMSADDVNAVAQYFASLPPPARPAPENIVQPPTGAVPGPGRSATSASSPQRVGAAGTVGTEQGAGTSGGSQGQGGTDQSSTVNKAGPTPGR